MRSPLSNAARAFLLALALAGIALPAPPSAVNAAPDAQAPDTPAEVPAPSAPTDTTAAFDAYGKLPLSFEANLGQANPEVKFLARGQGYSISLSPSEAVFHLRGGDERAAGGRHGAGRTGRAPRPSRAASVPLRMKLLGADSAAPLDGEDVTGGRSNYFTGSDPSKWVTDVPHYARVRQQGAYPGIDVVYYGRGRQLEYDFLLAPFADPAAISLAFEGGRRLSLDPSGDLRISTGAGDLIQEAPVAYQEVDGQRREVECRFTLDRRGRVRFRLGEYDRSLPLVIDPVLRLAYSTYLGGDDSDEVNGIAVDLAGSAYLTGTTSSAEVPGGGLRDVSDGEAVFVTKLNASGTAINYTTYLDGEKTDEANAVAVDSSGSAYVTGQTFSNRFPTLNPFQRDYNNCFNPPNFICAVGGDAFVTKLDAEGRLAYSTYLNGGGHDKGFGIAVDSSGKAYVTGQTESVNFPFENGYERSIGGFDDAFLTVFEPDGSDIVYSTALGGTRFDRGYAVAVTPDGRNVFVTGFTESNNFPTTPNAFRTENADGGDRSDAFLAHINPTIPGNESLRYSTFLGGAGSDTGVGVAVDTAGRAYVTGGTGSFDFPVKAPSGTSVLDATNEVNEAFVAKFDTTRSGDASLVYSTFLGGSGAEVGRGIAVDAAKNAYVVGDTSSATGLPVERGIQQSLSGETDAFVAKVNVSGSKVLYATYLGGGSTDSAHACALDASGNLYVAGLTRSNDLRTTPKVVQPDTNSPGRPEGFVMKLREMNADTAGVFRPSTNQFLLRNANASGQPNITAAFGQPGDLPVKGDWNGDGKDTIGVFRPSAGVFVLSNSNEPPSSDITVQFGQPGDLPVAGDWNGDGRDEIGLFRAGTFILRSNFAPLDLNINTFPFGAAGEQPLAGDWDGDGKDTIGTRAGCFFQLRNENSPGPLAVNICFGNGFDTGFVGDWDGDGVDTMAVFQDTGRGLFFALRNTNDPGNGAPDLAFLFGSPGDLPLGGDWDARP